MNSAKTAMYRTHPSAPLRELLQERMLGPVNGITVSARKKLRFLDYGCGHGVDLTQLQVYGYTAEGYDPNFQPKKPKGKFQIVLMIYVVNVIVARVECNCAIDDAWNYVKRGGQLVIVSRSHREVDREATKHGWDTWGDGYITGSGTYQQGYSPDQLHRLFCDRLDKVRNIQYGTMKCGASFVIVTKG